MFEPQDAPRIFALPPGADFPAGLVAGLTERLKHTPPEAMARVEVYLNSSRMRRRVRTLFQRQAPGFLPRLRLVTDLAGSVAPQDPSQTVSPLRRRLELAQLVSALIARDPSLAPGAAAFELADSLAALMGEMQVEGVPPEALRDLDVSDESGHWMRSLRFISLIQPYFAEGAAADPEARQRRAAEQLAASWTATPPDHPVIIAGSTGSRGSTALLMAAAARLPRGALILPGFDFDMPDRVWSALDDQMSGEDHPQFRFAHLLRRIGAKPGDVASWADVETRPARNRLVSLALRPAPVTDQWMTEGPRLRDIDEATRAMTLIEAPSPRLEAMAIALRLRDALDAGKTAALVSPDRMLTRQVTAALDRWALIPDDSAGRPLHLSAPGRFLRHIADLFGERLTAESLLTVLKHPLCHTGGQDRGPHLRQTLEFELWLRRKGPPFLTPQTVLDWGRAHPGGESAQWAEWLSSAMPDLSQVGVCPLAEHVARHIEIAETLAGGPGGGTGELWRKEAGIEAARHVEGLRTEAPFGGRMGPREYAALFLDVITGEIREPVQAHPDIMIWGTIEARVQGADLVILGGLNDGVWPEMPAPDPWLNRRMRQQAGLLLPERRVGLSAHDFQQAIGAPEVVLTRSTRDAETETVVSRWVNRLTNLLGGLTANGGPAALDAMRGRGQSWLTLAQTLENAYTPVAPATRPSPRPPVAARPRQLSVTQIQTLVRDPYAIYARHILGLRALDPLRQEPDAPLRGTVVHHIFERFVRDCPDPAQDDARALLLSIAHETLAQEVPWPTARRIWTARLTGVVDWFLTGEIERRQQGQPIQSMLEGTGAMKLADADFTLTGKADRIDRRTDGRLVIYDYKTGKPPTPAEMTYFDKQLLLEAAMAEAGGFEGLPPCEVAEVAYIGLGTKPEFKAYPLRDHGGRTPPLDPGDTADRLRELVLRFGERAQGYASRRAMHKRFSDGDYDHLARFGEWDESQPPDAGDVG